MGEFNKFIEQGNPINNNAASTTGFVPVIQKTSSNKSSKTPKKPSTKTDSNELSCKNSSSQCTTIDLQIQIHDSIKEEPAEETKYQPINSNIHNDNGKQIPSATFPTILTTAMDPYNFNKQNMKTFINNPTNAISNNYASIPKKMHNSTTTINNHNNQCHNGNSTTTTVHSYALPRLNYSEKESNSPLMNQYNASRANVANNSVNCDQVINWRSNNVIMSE